MKRIFLPSIALSVLSFLSGVPLVSALAAPPTLKPLHFPADKNNLQVLPQRFEYTLIDEDRLKVGDILIDFTQVSFQLEPAKEKGRYVIRFSWPAGLLKNGSLSIKNNSGKAIYTTELDSSKISVTAGKPLEGEEQLRTEIAHFVSEEVEGSVVDEMKYLPFMTFCIFKGEEATRLYFCSKELYLSSHAGQMTVKSRSTTKKHAQVDVNGKVVGNQGFISLDNREETVAFRALTQTGAFLEIETRRKDVDFKDVIMDTEGKRILITASGALPVDQSKVKKISEDEWKLELSAARPLLYLNGEGDIPMRQEFYIRGPLPKENERPFVSAKSVSRIYGSEARISGIAPAKTQVSNQSATDTLQKLPKNQFTWTMSEIPRGEVTRRYLSLESGENKFVVAYDIFRGTPYELSLSAKYQSPSGSAFGELQLQTWFENFLGINSRITRFHWGLALAMTQPLTTGKDQPKIDMNQVTLLWRAQEGFYLEDASWGLRLPISMINIEGSGTMAPGVGFFYLTPSPKVWGLLDWMHLTADYYLSSSGGDIKIKSGYQVKALFDKKLSPTLSWRYGLGLSTFEFDTTTKKSEMQIAPEIGAAWRF
jgi:hypothetical protein